MKVRNPLPNQRIFPPKQLRGNTNINQDAPSVTPIGVIVKPFGRISGSQASLIEAFK
jgi:hypothetical protein